MAIIDNNWKLISFPSKSGKNFELYNLRKDKVEKQNLISENILIFQYLNKYLSAAHLSIEKSVNGYDYPENKLNLQPPRRFWTEIKSYKKHFKQWRLRPEYKSRLQSK
jgi:hypothetical protein